MGLFSRKKTEEKPARPPASISKALRAGNTTHSVAGEDEKKTGKKPEKKAEVVFDKSGAFAKNIILEPWMTEKSHDAMAINKYVFIINKNSDKAAVKKAVESLYKVHVTDVNVVNIHSKERNYGRFSGTKSGYKKAFVTVKAGEKIELFKGV